MMTCPLCPAPTTPWTLEAHIAVAHPEHHVHVMTPQPICPHTSLGSMFLHGPDGNITGIFAGPNLSFMN